MDKQPNKPTLQENVLRLTYEIKSSRNYEKAAQIVIDNNIYFSDIVANTLKINIFELAKLADSIKLIKSPSKVE